MTGRTMERHLIKLYSNRVRKALKINNTEQLCRDIDEDSIIKESMADIGILMVSTFGKWLSPILVSCHTANHTESFATAKSSKQEELEQEK